MNSRNNRNRAKLLVISLAVMSFIFTMIPPCLAMAKIGLVDMAQIVQKYDKAKEVQADFQISQAKMKKMIENAREQVNKAKGEEAKKETEKQLTEQILKENNTLKQDFTKKWEAVQTNIMNSIKKVSKNGQYDLVVNKQTVITGGEDITDKVLADLKKQSK